MLLTVVIICEVSMMLQAMLQNMPSWQNWCSVSPSFLCIYYTELAKNNNHIPCVMWYVMLLIDFSNIQQTFQNGTSSTKATSRVCVRRGPGSMERGGYMPGYGAGGFLPNTGASYRDPGPRLDRWGGSSHKHQVSVWLFAYFSRTCELHTFSSKNGFNLGCCR